MGTELTEASNLWYGFQWAKTLEISLGNHPRERMKKVRLGRDGGETWVMFQFVNRFIDGFLGG